jgi:hypothetical protein
MRDLKSPRQPARRTLMRLSPVMSLPSKRMRPPASPTCPAIALNMVVLPAPFGPISPVMRPGGYVEADVIDDIGAAVTHLYMLD